MGQIISIQTFILGILSNVNRPFKGNDQTSIRQELENNLKSLRGEHMNLSYIYVNQQRRIATNAVMMEELENKLNKKYDSIQDIEYACENCTTKVDIAFKSVEKTLSAVLFDIRRSQADIFGRIEGYSLSNNFRQEDAPYIENISILLTYLKWIFNDIANHMKEINNLALDERISKLELKDNIIDYLKASISKGTSSMYYWLMELIDKKLAIPQHKDDNFSLDMLELLCTGVDVYLYMLAFVLQQYTILCHTYYHKSDIDKYNEYFFKSANAFDDFSSLVIDMSDMIVNVLITVEKLEFIPIYRKDVTEFIALKLDKLKPIKGFLLDNYHKLVQVNRPERLTPDLDYASSKIETPILEWISGSVLFYAVQFLGNSTEPFSVTSFWSNGDTIDRLANPSVSIYRDPLERTRVIFRHIANGQTQIVAVINNAEQVVFRDTDRDLYNAVNRFDEKEALKYVKIYLGNGANASAVFEDNRGAIHAAAQNNQWTVAEELIKTDANLVNAIDGNGHTPIYIATEAGHESFVQNLLNVKGIDVNVPTSKKNHQLTALHCAVYKGHTEIVKKLMQIPLIDVNAKTTDGFTALHFATCFNQTEIISILSNFTRTDFNVLSGQSEIPLLLNCSANDKHIESLVNSGNVSPLQMASAFADKFSIKNLLQNHKMQTTIHTKTNDGSNVLHFAAFNQDENILSVFESHMNINQTVDAQDDHEFTPLYNGLYTKNAAMSNKLMHSYCANEAIRLSNNKTLLHLAVMHGHAKTASSLVINWANLLAIDAQGRTPLHYAVWFGDIEIVKTISSRGVIQNVFDSYGIPAIHLVINLTEDKALAIIRLLVDTVDLNVRGFAGNTLLHYMCALGYVSVVKYLFTIPKIDPNIFNYRGETILHVAAYVGSLDLVNFLIDKVKLHPDPYPDQCISVMCYAVKGKEIYEEVTIDIIHSLEKVETMSVKELMVSVEMHKNDLFGDYEWNDDIMQGKNVWDLFFASLKFGNCYVACYCFKNETFKDTFPHNVIFPARGWTALYYTLFRGNGLKMVKCIIDNAPDYMTDLDVDDSTFQKSLLHLAIGNVQVDVAHYLLDADAPFDSADLFGNTQLHQAAQNGLYSVVKRLIEKGATESINSKNNYNHTPLYLATSYYGNLELVKYLLGLGGNLDGDDNTLVNVAARANKTDLVMHFISLGVDSARANNDGVTPLHYAAMNNNLELVNYLLDQDKIDVNAQTLDKRTALHYAIQYDGDIDVVNSLLDKYATVDFDYNAENPLTIAIEQNKNDIAKMLLLADAPISKYGTQTFKFPLLQAIYSDNVEMLQILLERGAYPDLFTFPNYTTPIQVLAECSCDRSIKFFAYDYKDENNKTLLHILASPDDADDVTVNYNLVQKILLERGAYVDAQDNEGNSPLHLAAKYGQLDFVKMICEMKQECIRVELKNANNQTALDLARLNDHGDGVVKFLEDWRPHSRARRQLVEQFSEPPVVSSSASRASWWVRELIGSVFDTFGSITKQTYQSMTLSSPYHESTFHQSISTPSPSVNVQGTLLVDVLARKFTGQSYVGTDSHSVSPLHARSNSLCIVQQFERMLNRLGNETNSQLASDLDSFELYCRVEHCLLSGQYSKINRILLSTAQDAFPYDSVDDSLLVMSVEELLSEVLFGKCRFEFGLD